MTTKRLSTTDGHSLTIRVRLDVETLHREESTESSEGEIGPRLIIYDLPFDTQRSEVESLLSKVSHSIEVEPTAPNIVLQSYTIKTDNNDVKIQLLQEKYEIRGHKVRINVFDGKKTEIIIEKSLKERVVYIKGIPRHADPNQVRSDLLYEISESTQLYIPQTKDKKNQHFAFLVCSTLEEKIDLLSTRKLSTGQYTYKFSDYCLNLSNKRNNRAEIEKKKGKKISKMFIQKFRNRRMNVMTKTKNKGEEIPFISAPTPCLIDYNQMKNSFRKEYSRKGISVLKRNGCYRKEVMSKYYIQYQMLEKVKESCKEDEELKEIFNQDSIGEE